MIRSVLTCALAKIIQNGKLTHAEIARRAGTSRTRATAVANANTRGTATDLLIRVLSAAGHKAELHVRRAAASSSAIGRSVTPVARQNRRIIRVMPEKCRVARRGKSTVSMWPGQPDSRRDRRDAAFRMIDWFRGPAQWTESRRQHRHDQRHANRRRQMVFLGATHRRRG
jgi:predicted XRE-type DNA-binding protein